MPVLAMSAGTVTAVWGTAYIRLSNGTLKPVQVGDKVAGGARIITEDDGIVEIRPSKGHPVLVNAAPEGVNKVISGIEAQDPEQVPAAGVTGGADGGMQPGLRVDRVSESVGQQTYQFSDTSVAATPVSLGSSADQRPLVLNEAEATPSSTTPATGPRVLSVSDAQTGEGGTLDFHIKLTNDSATTSQDSTLVLKLSGVGAHPGVPGLDTSSVVKVSFDSGEGVDAKVDGQGNIVVPVSAFTPAGTDIVVHVQTAQDDLYEGPETIQLSAATNHDTAPTQAVGTITDDADRPYMLVREGEPATEGDPIVFNVVLTHASTTPVTVKLALQDGTDDPTTPEKEGATLGVDTGTQLEYETADGTWAALPDSNELTFEPGQTLLHVRVATVDDQVHESTEYIKLKATVVDGDTVNQSHSNQTSIVDNDAAPYMLVLNGEPATEGDPIGFNVVLTRASSTPVTVKLALQDGTDDPATPENEGATLGVDTGTQLEYETADGTWVALPTSNELTFEPGQTQLHVRVATIHDNVGESTEFIKLEATVVDGDTANHSQSNQTAIIDAPPYMLVLNGEPATEGDPVGFNLVLTHASVAPVSVSLALHAGSDDANTLPNESATPGVDTATQLEWESSDGVWSPVTGPLTFSPGETQIHVRVATFDDQVAEDVEFIRLQATVTSGDTVNETHANQTAIVDNDGATSAANASQHTDGAASGTEIIATPAADVFAWHLVDRGTAEAPSVYTIKGFEAKTPATGGDALDLRDLLQGEHTSDGSIGNLDHYLRIDSSDTSSVIRISPTGDFAPGDAHSGMETQRIVLEGVNLRSAMSLDAAAPDAQVIASLLQQNKLLVDHA